MRKICFAVALALFFAYAQLAAAAPAPARAVVRYRGSARQAAALARAHHLRTLQLIPQLHALVVSGSQTDLQALKANPAVAVEQADPTVRALGDPFDSVLTWPASQLDLADAWLVTPGSHRVVVAVLDTGVNSTQDLSGVLLPGADATGAGGDTSDQNGHGTAVAETIAAIGGNDFGTTGACQCSILPVKVMGADGTGLDSWIAAGVIWAADHGANVVNLSLGGPGQDQVLADAVNYALGKGVIVVAAAGNNSSQNLFYPAADPGVVSVAATDENGQLADYSNHSSGWVDVAAPGCAYAQSNSSGSVIVAPNNNVIYYSEWCGTSFATPEVSALAGLALSWQPGLSADQVVGAIEQSAAPGLDVKYGAVNAFSMFKQLGAVHPPQATTAPQLLGKAQVGQTVIASDAVWQTLGVAQSQSLVIQRCSKTLDSCRTVSDQGSYTVAATDLGYRLRAVAAVTDLGGTTVSVSTASAPVAAAPAHVPAKQRSAKTQAQPKARSVRSHAHGRRPRRSARRGSRS